MGNAVQFVILITIGCIWVKTCNGMTKLSQEHNAPNHNIRSLSHHSRKARRPNSLPSGWIRLALLRDGTYLSNYRKLARKFNSKIKRYSKLTGFNALTLDDSKARSLNLFDGINMPRQDSHSISNLTSGYSGTPARNFAPEEQVWVQRRSTSAAVVPSAVKGDFGTIPFIPKRIGELRNSNLIGSSACKNFSRTGTLSKPSPSLLGGKVSPSNANISTESIGGETIMAANNTNMHFVTFNETNFGQKLKDAEKQKQHHVSIHRSRSLDGNFSRRKLKKKGRKKGNKHNKYFLARKLKSFLNDFKSLLLATGNQQVMQGVAEEFYKDITEKSNFHDHGKHNSNAFSKKSRKYKQKYLKNNEKKARSDELISSKNHSHENELSLKEKNQSTDDKLWKYNGEAVRTFSDLYGTSVRKLVGKSALYNATETKRLDKNALLKYISAQNILRSGWNFLPRERNRAGLDRMMNLLRSRLAAMRKAREKNTVGNSTSDKIKGGIANLGMKSSSTIKDSNESSDSSRLEQSEIAGQNRSRVNNVLPSYQITRNDFPQTPNLPLRRISSVPIGLVMNSIQTGSFPKPDIMQKESEALLSMHLVSGSISEASSFGQFQTVPLNVAMSKIDFSAADSLEKRDLGLTSFARIITSSPSFSNMPFASGPSMTSQTTSQILNASLMPLELGSNKDGELVSDLLEAYDFVLKEKLLGPFVPGTGLKAPSIVQGSVQPTLSFSLTNVIRTRSDAKILGKSKPSSIIDTPQNGQPFLDEEAEPRLKEIVPLVDEADQKNGSNNFPIEGKELFLLQNLNNLVHFSPSTSTRMPLAKNPSSLHGFPPSSTTGVPPAIKEGSPGGVSLAGNETDAEIRSVASVVETPSIQESNTSLESQTGQGSNLDAKSKTFLVTLEILNRTFDESLNSVQSKQFQQLRELIQTSLLGLYRDDQTFVSSKLNGVRRNSRNATIYADVVLEFATDSSSHLALLNEKVKSNLLGNIRVSDSFPKVVLTDDSLPKRNWCSMPCVHPYSCFPSCAPDCCKKPSNPPSIARPAQLMRYNGLQPMYQQFSYPAPLLYNYPYSQTVPCWPGCSPICYPQCTYVCCMAAARGK